VFFVFFQEGTPMVDKRITTELVVKAVDQYSNSIKSMSGVTGRFAANVRSEMSRLQAMRGPLRMIEDYKSAQSTFSQSEAALRRAREEVAKMRRDMRATETPTKKMVQDFDRAKRAAERLRLAHEKNASALTQLRGKLRSAGVNTGDLASEQHRLTSALGAANTAFARQADRLQRLKVMQDRIAASRARMDKSLERAAYMSFVGQASIGVGRRILGSTSDVANRSGDQQAAFTEFQNLTGADDGRIAQLRGELNALRGVTKQSVDEMLAGLEVLVGKGMDLEDALGALPATARAAFATGTSSDEMGGAGFALYDNLKVSPEDLRQAYDIMAMGGKEGGFELSAMAKSFPEITAGARALKMEGLDSVAQLTAALQIAMKSAGSEGQAATNLSNFLGKLTSPATVRKFAEVGISIEEELQKAMDRGVSPMEHMLEVISKQTGGDALKMGALFEDKQVLDFLRAMIPNMEEYARIRDKASGAEGVVDDDLSRKMRDFNVQKGQLSESVGRLFTLPPEALETLSTMLKRADAFVEKLIVWKDAHPAFVKGLFLGTMALGGMAVAGGALLAVGASLIGTLAVLRFGLVGLGARGAFAAGEIGLIRAGFRGLRGLSRFALSALIAPIRWGKRLIPSVPWARMVGGLRWSTLIKPLMWTGRGALRFIPVIGWASLAGELAWHLLIKPLGWDKYLSLDAFAGYLKKVKAAFSWGNLVSVIKWSTFLPLAPFRLVLHNVFGFEWPDFLPKWSWDFIPEFDASNLIKWPDLPGRMDWLMGRDNDDGAITSQESAVRTTVGSAVRKTVGPAREVVPLAGARATGGPIKAGLPYLAGERGPEPIFASRSAFVATNAQMQNMQRVRAGAQRIRTIGLAALTTSALVGPSTSAAASSTAVNAQANTPSTAHVEIHGGIHIVAPSGVSDPEGLVDLLEARLGERLASATSASFYD
jgi:hypothetical protein